jgi:uncharacterized coiled-coil DUF342 family protein
MAERAKITSVEALEAFQTALVLYIDKARRVVDEVGEEVKRTRTWIESDRLVHWKNEVKRRTRMLEMKQQELFSARIGNLAEPTQSHRQAVRKAKQAVDDAQTRVDGVRRWAREYENRVSPLARHIDQLRHTLVVDMAKAVASLQQSLDALHDYAGVASSKPSPPPESGS